MTGEHSEVDLIRGVASRRVVAAHHHERYAIGVATSGAHRMRCRGATFLVEPGDIVVVAPGEMHGAEPAGDEGWSYEMIYVPDLIIGDVVNEQGGSASLPMIHQPVLRDRELSGRISAVCEARFRSEPSLGLDEAIVSMVYLLFSDHSAHPSRGDSGLHREPRAVREVRSILHSGFCEPVRLAELAAQVGLNANYLVTVFTRATGVPPHRYLDQIRIARAQAMIGDGHALSYVAAAVGYCDQSHLTRQFKRLIGVTPGVYRRLNGTRGRLRSTRTTRSCSIHERE